MDTKKTIQSELTDILTSSHYGPVIDRMKDFFAKNASSPARLSDHTMLQQLTTVILNEDVLDSYRQDLIRVFDHLTKHGNPLERVGKDVLLRPFHTARYPDTDTLLTLINIANQQIPGFDVNHSTPSMANFAASFAKSKNIGPGALRQLMDLGGEGSGISKGLPSLFFLDRKDEYYLPKFKLLVSYGANPLEKVSLNDQPALSYHDLVKAMARPDDKYDPYNKSMKIMDAYQIAALEQSQSMTKVRRIKV